LRRGIGKWLAGLETRWLFVVALVCLALAGLLIALLAPRGAGLIALPAAVGIVALGLGIHRVLRKLVQSREKEERGGFVALLVATIVAVLAIAAFCVYSLSFYWKETVRVCWQSQQGETVEIRERALATGLERLRSPFSILPELVGFSATYDCQAGAWDLELVRQGECPFYMIEGVPCTCGAERWPDDAQCEHARCIRHEEVPRLSCEH
jgi:hypothetical protein